MAYIGKQPVVGNFQKCDAISVVNGQAAYSLTVGSAAVTPENVNHMLVSLNGVLQAPGDSFTVSGSTLTFASNLATGDVIDFVIILGDVLDLGTPSDNSITTAKLASDAVTEAKIADDAVESEHLNNNIISGQTALAEAPADTDELLLSDGGTLKRIDYSYIKSSPTHTLLSTSTISANTSAVTFDSSIITSTYKRYMVDFIDIHCDAGALLYWNISDDNGSTYKTSSNYVYAVHGFESSGNDQTTTATGNSRFVLTPQDHSTNALRPMSLRMIVQPGKISSSRNVFINYYTFGIAQDNEHAVTFNGAGYFASGEDKTFNNYKFFPSSGNFDAGLIKVYGIA